MGSEGDAPSMPIHVEESSVTPDGPETAGTFQVPETAVTDPAFGSERSVAATYPDQLRFGEASGAGAGVGLGAEAPK